MDLLRKIVVGDETTPHLPKEFQYYLPAHILISQKMKETFNLASVPVSAIRSKLMEYSPLLMKYVGVTVDAARATQPSLKKYVGVTVDAARATQPYLKKYVVVTVDAARATLPYLKNIEVYCVEKIKQHPYLVIGFIVLPVLYKYCTFGGSAGTFRKMMKAPGRPYRMPRDVFESNPRSYFQGLRKMQ